MRYLTLKQSLCTKRDDTYRQHTARIHRHQLAETKECRSLLVVVLDVPQDSAPRLTKAGQMARDGFRVDETKSTNSDGRVFEQRFGRRGVEKDSDQALGELGNVGRESFLEDRGGWGWI